jgi:hypothetical protein
MSSRRRHAELPSDERITHWRTDPTLCRGLAFLQAHRPMLLAHRKIPRADA